jgi:phage shock protein A
MKAKISKIILWPKRIGEQPRIIPFKMAGVEVITGQSQTGKSSLISIVDYCLGGDKCTIPVGEIRDAVEWFGIVLRLPKSEMLVARRNPGLQSATNEMYLEESPTLELRDELESNSNSTAVVNRLNQIAGLPNLPLADSDESSFGGRPSFRDTAAFQFQPQHIVANPHTLFFKADTFEHQEKLKYFFPFVLGAIDGQTLEVRRQLRSAEAELKTKREQLEERRTRSNVWLQDFRAFYSQARENGLLHNSPDPVADWNVETFVRYLEPVPSILKQQGMPKVERGATQRMTKEIAALRKEEESITQGIADRRRKLTKVEQLRSSTDSYSQALSVQSGRLEPLHWFSDRVAKNHACPVCGTESESANGEIKRLTELAKRVEGSIGTIENVNEVLDKEAALLGEQLRKLEDDLTALRTHLEGLESRSEELKAQRQTIRDIYTFGGRLEEALRNYHAADRGSALVEAITKLEQKIIQLRAKVDQNAINRKQEAALDAISKTIRHYTEILGVEHFEQPARIDIRNLMLVIEGPHGRRDHLWEIGSGANHMGYHIATLLALHEHFLNVSHNPVPQFLIVDQPSQAFFPEGWPPRSAQNKTGKLPEQPMPSDDIARVNRIFRAFSEASVRTKNRLQIIVIDHADEVTWQGVGNVSVAQRWRGGDALIPRHWLKRPA